jgi:hypothetical protein
MDVSIILLCKKNFFDLTAIRPQISKIATIELITAFSLAKTCGLKPGVMFSFVFARIDTAAKTMTEKIRMMRIAFLSFFCQTAKGIIKF